MNEGMEPDSGEAERQAESFLMPETREAVTGRRVKGAQEKHIVP